MRRIRPLRSSRRHSARRLEVRRLGKSRITVIPFDFAKANSRARRNGWARYNPLSEDQEKALQDILAALDAPGDDRKVLVLAGPAGTGKTTLMREVIRLLDERGQAVALMAPTGKAAARLRESTGMNTSTIHSYIFSGAKEKGVCPACGKASKELAISKAQMRDAGMKGLTCPNCGTFHPIGTKFRTELEFRNQEGKRSEGTPMMIIDEASMVSKALQDKIFTRKPFNILYVGDREQLPPFGDTPDDRIWGPNFDSPTALLTQIHRQAADNPIISWATRLRNDENKENPFIVGKEDPNAKIQFFIQPTIPQVATWYRQQVEEGRSAIVLCSAHAMCERANKAIRSILPFAGTNRSLAAESKKVELPFVAGDQLMSIFNKAKAGIMNGEIFPVVGSSHICPELTDAGFSYVTIQNSNQEQTFIVNNEQAQMNARDAGTHKREVDYFTNRYRDLLKGFQQQYGEEAESIVGAYSDEDLFKAYKVIRPERMLYAVYGYAITTQKSQGSQWQSVGVIWDPGVEQRWNDPDTYTNTRRWLYTAITRTSDRVAVFDLSGHYTQAIQPASDRRGRMGLALPASTRKADRDAFAADFRPRWEPGTEYTDVEFARLLDRATVPGFRFTRMVLRALDGNRWILNKRGNDEAVLESLLARWAEIPAHKEEAGDAQYDPYLGKALHSETVRFLLKYRNGLIRLGVPKNYRRGDEIAKVNPRRRLRRR